jgi:hypothetical protein
MNGKITQRAIHCTIRGDDQGPIKAGNSTQLSPPDSAISIFTHHYVFVDNPEQNMIRCSKTVQKQKIAEPMQLTATTAKSPRLQPLLIAKLEGDL